MEVLPEKQATDLQGKQKAKIREYGGEKRIWLCSPLCL